MDPYNCAQEKHYVMLAYDDVRIHGANIFGGTSRIDNFDPIMYDVAPWIGEPAPRHNHYCRFYTLYYIAFHILCIDCDTQSVQMENLMLEFYASREKSFPRF